MRLRKCLFLGLLILTCFFLSGCDQKLNLAPLVRNTPTPVPSSDSKSSQTSAAKKAAATPTSAPVPAGASVTPSPRRVGIREGSAGSVLISNSSGQRIRQVFLQTSGSDSWGRNLIPGEASVYMGEVFQLYYPPLSSGGSYNLRMVDNNSTTYEIYGVDLTDMQNAILRMDDQGSVYLAYMSLSSGAEEDTRGSSWSSGNESGEDEESQYYDPSSFNPFAYRNVTGTPTPSGADSGTETDAEEWDYIGDGSDAWDYNGYDAYSGDGSYDYNDYDDSYDSGTDEYYGIPYDDEWDYQSENY